MGERCLVGVMNNPQVAIARAELAKVAHNSNTCEGGVCVVHNPSNHGMQEWTFLYRSDRNIVERICPHGIGHPDPDQIYWWNSSGLDYQGIHGCDGCCHLAKVCTEALGDQIDSWVINEK